MNGLLVLIWIVGMLGCAFRWWQSSSDGWWTTRAWAHRDPAAAEPSDTAYALGRVQSVLGAVVVMVMAIVLWDSGDSAEKHSPYTPSSDSYSPWNTDYCSGLRFAPPTSCASGTAVSASPSGSATGAPSAGATPSSGSPAPSRTVTAPATH